MKIEITVIVFIKRYLRNLLKFYFITPHINIQMGLKYWQLRIIAHVKCMYIEY